ncbi:hypothetical protein OPQ81_000046 [Rhizoctonia solani]|nr:hypothetical protein OPQ81_000046 [Rhizoctonia solani]
MEMALIRRFACLPPVHDILDSVLSGNMATHSQPAQPHSTISANADSQAAPGLAGKRPPQWRRFSQDPFELPKKDSIGSGSTQEERDTDSVTALKGDFNPNVRPAEYRSYTDQTQMSVDKSLKSPQSLQLEPPELLDKSKSLKPRPPKLKHYKLKHPGPEWVHLDLLNYFVFFSAVMWLWASQTLYSIHFYTNDWFHLTLTSFQLFFFGMLAATTLGYDVTAYITHSPGVDTLSPIVRDSNDPQIYEDEKKFRLSTRAIAIAFAGTRAIHFIQYLRVFYYAYFPIKTRKSSANKMQNVLPQPTAVFAGLWISNPMFIAALVIAYLNLSETRLGASLRMGLWIGGFLVELFSHIFGTALHSPPGVQLGKRLQTVTTIILGEGINGIAGTLTAILIAPEVGVAMKTNVFCTACSIWFIAYIYFEGPKGERVEEQGGQEGQEKGEGKNRETPADPPFISLRYMLWLILHLPFLASIVFLFMGVKGQFALMNFLSTLFKSTSGFNRIFQQQLSHETNGTLWRTNAEMKHFLLKRGIVWEDEYNKLDKALLNITGADRRVVTAAWSVRLSLTIVVKAFKDFNKADDISNEVQSMIDNYYQDNSTALVYQDSRIMNADPQKTIYYQILTGLLEGPLRSTRYIVGFAGLILISLGLQDCAHSKLEGWYQKGVIASRILIGIVLSLLLLLNIVIRWMEAFWVLPTIAIAYGVEFCIEIVLWAWHANMREGETSMEAIRRWSKALYGTFLKKQSS